MITSVTHTGFVVPDVMAIAKEYCDAYGIGPWKFYEMKETDFESAEYYGKPVSIGLKIAMCDFSNISFELIQPVGNQGVFAQFLQKHGPGLHHLAVSTVNSLEEALKVVKSTGAPIVQTLSTRTGERYVFTDHLESLGTCLELAELPKGRKLPKPIGVYPDGPEVAKYGFSTKNPMITRIKQLAFVVNDRVKVAKEFYDFYGVGPWFFHQIDHKSDIKIVHNGKPVEIEIKSISCNDTNPWYEYIQPLDTFSNYGTYLRDSGPGLHHICVETANKYEEAINIMEREGKVATQTSILEGIEKGAHMNHLDTLGCYFELVFCDKDFVPPIQDMYPPGSKPAKPTCLKKVF